MKLGGQLRVTSGMTISIIGWDMSAAFTMGAALGVSGTAIAEYLPELEAVAVEKMNEGLRNSDGTS